MAHTVLISTTELEQNLNNPDWVVVDCRFDLTNTRWGLAAYQTDHIPNAVYAHLDHDLSGEKTGRNGRHPLPDWKDFERRVRVWGISSRSQVIVYDQDIGMYASRLWWMLKYVGHETVAVLEGGWAKWAREGRAVQTGAVERTPTDFSVRLNSSLLLTAEDVAREWLNDPTRRLIDARAPERYRGEVEPLDKVAGHLPGAANYFYKDNVNADGIFRPAEELRARFLELLGNVPPEEVAHYCGSGVSAVHNILAMQVASLPLTKLYAGSWSEWSSEAGRPVARA
jgi:thiosulfate/3-mercaptopyruvate sulfurtransferase